MLDNFKDVAETLRNRFAESPLGKQLEGMDFDNIDNGFLAVVGGSNAAHVQLLAKFADVVEVDTVRPAGGVEGIEDLFWYFPQFQQEIVDIDTCRIHQRHRYRRFLNAEALCQDSMKNDRRFSARHERIGICIISAQPELPPCAKDVVSSAERCPSLVERVVINRNICGGKSTLNQHAATHR